MTKFLASVRNVPEALLACAAGADWIDLKAPDRGSLGALTPGEIRSIVAALEGRKPISATVGDGPMRPETLTRAVAAAFDAGVDYVKVGLAPGEQDRETLQALQAFTRNGRRLVAVLFADQAPELGWPGTLSDAGFAGCMLDTLNKTRGSLTDVCTLPYLRAFVAAARNAGLLCGLAGSLKLADIPVLLDLGSDYLGFRGALCLDRTRTQQINFDQLRQIRAAMNRPADPGCDADLRRFRSESTSPGKPFSALTELP